MMYKWTIHSMEFMLLDVDWCLWYYRRALLTDAGWSSGSSSGS